MKFGNLFMPSIDLSTTCKVTEQIIRIETDISIINFQKTLQIALRNVLGTEVFVELRKVDDGEHKILGNHVYNMLKLIVASYIKLRFHHIAKSKNLVVNPETVRSAYTKTIQFKGQ